MQIEDVAEICHTANKCLCERLGDMSQPGWKDAPEWQKQSARKGVEFHLTRPDSTPEDSHKEWLAVKENEGWKYGPIKDADKKEHPCFVPYAELPKEQQAKDYLFRGIVHSLRTFVIYGVSSGN